MNNVKFKREKSNKLNQLFKEEKWKEARYLILQLLKDHPNDHFLLTRLSTTYYEEKKYEKALEYVEQAYKLAPKCPLVLWDFAGTLDMLERNEDAINIYKSIIKKGARRVAYGEGGEGIRDARKLVNDCRYRVGLLYSDINKFNLALKYVKSHIANRGRNTPSIYNLRDVKRKLALLRVGKNPRGN